MAETQLKNQVCGECGSDIRAESLFCYHCGGSLENSIDEKKNTDEPSDVWFRSEIAPAKKIQKETVDKTASHEDDKSKTKKPLDEKIIDVKTVESGIEEVSPKAEKVTEDKVVNNVSPKPFKEKPLVKSSRGRYSKRNAKKSSEAKLKTASSLRKREKPSRLKKVEVIWEERDDSPNIWFIVFASLLSLVAAALVFAAFYLK